jgi:hypothetical protein
VDAPVVPEVPELAPLVAEPFAGAVLVEPPEAPMLEVAPDLVDGSVVLLAVPAADPIPEAVPEAVLEHAAKPAAQARARSVVLIMI